MTKQEIKTELNGAESLFEIDNVMENIGFSSVFDHNSATDLLNNGSVSYQVDDENWINIEFNVKELNEENPGESTIEITAVEEI